MYYNNYGGSFEAALGIFAVIAIVKLLGMGLGRIGERSVNKKIEKMRREHGAAEGGSDSIIKNKGALKASKDEEQSATLVAQTKTCVYCAEDINAAAIRCKHCESFLPEIR